MRESSSTMENSGLKVLMMTPAVDETLDILGFIATWVRKLSERADKLYVITPHYDKRTPLPENVTVCGLKTSDNKPDDASKQSILLNALRWRILLHSTMLKIVPQVDVVFCHMYPRFTIWVSPYAKLFRVPIVTWYSHAHVSRQLKIAHLLSDRIVTASKDSFNIKSHKVIVTGHGIDTDRFRPATNAERNKDKKVILSLGRISPVKDYKTLIKAADILVNKMGMKDVEILMVGGAPAAHDGYYHEILRLVDQFKLHDYIKFLGSVPWVDTVKYYQTCDIFVNMLNKSGVDKATAEAMACEKPVIVCDETYRELLRPYDELCLFKPFDPESMADKLATLLANEQLWHEIGKTSRQNVVERHSINQLADKLAGIFQELMVKGKRR